MTWNCGKVDKLLLGDFKFRSRFQGLTDDQLSQALQIVNAQFSGVYHLWSILPPDERRAKRELCINYLLGWQLANSYPENAVGVQGVGAIPLDSKKIGPIMLHYRSMVRQGGSVLDILTTNEFGLEALLMLQTAPETYLLMG